MIALLLVVFTLHSRIADAQANLIANMAPGTWLEVPNSHMDAVGYNGPLARSIRGASGIKAVMGAWSGGALDTTRDILYVTGGGHENYWGDEVYGFNLNSLTWSRIIDPKPLQVAPANPECPDESLYPCSHHTYDALSYLPSPVDKLLLMGEGNGAAQKYTSNIWEVVYLLGNLAGTPAWEVKGHYPYPSTFNDSGPRIGAFGAYDPTSGYYFYHSSAQGELMSYNPATDSWKEYGGDKNYTKEAVRTSYFCTAAVDPVDKLFVAIGYQCSGAVGLGIGAWNISNTSAPYISGYRPVTTGAQDAQLALNPGFVWDSAINKFVAWNGGSTVYTLDPTTWTWTAVNPSSANTVTPTAANPQGTFGRFQYDPKLDVFVVVNAAYQDVYIYKPDFNNTASPSNCSVPVVTNTSLSPTTESYKPFTYTITASGATTAYWANSLPLGMSINDTTGVISGVPTTVGIYTAHIGAQNACGVSSGAALAINVIPGNHFKIRATAYPDLQTAINAATAGDTINVDAGTYVNMYTDIKKSVTIQGVGGFAHFSNDQYIPNGKGIFVILGTPTVIINNLEFSGAKVGDGNGTSIRYQGGLLTVENSYFHDNEMGLLGGPDPAGQITIANSVFDHNGKCPPKTGCNQGHNIYIGVIAKFVVMNSTFKNTDTGHHIKSRALETDISNTIEDDGDIPVGASFSIDLPNGGTANITCNKAIKNPNAQNGPMITFAEEVNKDKNVLRPVNSLNVANSLFVNNVPASRKDLNVAGVRNCLGARAPICNGSARTTPMTAIVSDNKFVRVPAGRDAIGPVTLSNNIDTTTDQGMPSSCGPIGANLSVPVYVSPQTPIQASTPNVSFSSSAPSINRQLSRGTPRTMHKLRGN